MNAILSKTNFPFAWPLRVAVTGLAGFLLPLALAAEPPAPAIVPLPVKMAVQPGVFTVTPETVIVADAASSATAGQLAESLKPATGFVLTVTAQAPAGAKASITLLQDQSLARRGREGYQMTVTPEGIRLAAAGQAGLFYGVQTLRQLLPPQIFSTAPVKEVAWTVPCVTIEDQPRFAWRGLMLDSGHDFQRKEFVKRFIDLMALHKFNLFHWHLTDLGTWSLEIKGRPKLLDPATRGPGVKPGFYTQDEIREVVSYAAARHITVLPEIDMPGHEPPALIAYPELDCPTPQLDQNGKPVRPWEFCVGNEKTYAFLEEVLSQVVGLFPGPYVHIGGDECPKQHWLSCPICQAKIKAEKLNNGEELQSYFVKRIEKFLESKNRRMIGWDEILEGGLAPKATVMSWRGMGGGIAAAKANHDVVMAPTAWTYFDYPDTPVEKVYSFEPVPQELTAEQATHVLGAQAQMWTDTHPSEDRIDALVYPRAAALSEVVWSPAASRDYEAFVARLQGHLPRLAALGVHYQPLAATGTVFAHWTTEHTSPTPKTVDWPITAGVKGPGNYDIIFKFESGKSRYQIHAVEIVQDGKVLATDKHFGWSGASDKDNVYHVALPQLSAAPLILRATVSTDFGPDSNGRIMIGKTP
jgi:hexosaminidase